MILALRTDKPEAELYLLSPTGKKLAEHSWQADRELADSLLKTLDEFLTLNKTGFDKLSGIIIYEGPGSFTGLRIGASVANAAAYSQNIPVIGSSGKAWLESGRAKLKNAKPGHYATPEYGAPPNITKPKK